MNLQDIANKLQFGLREKGFRSAIVSASRATDLRRTIEENLEKGRITKKIYSQNSANFDEMISRENSWAKSIIAVAAPRPILELVFSIKGEKRSTIIPPTYESSIDEIIGTIIDNHLKPHGYLARRAILPQKLLATKSGMGRYGKNNIAYVDGMGSFHRLIAFYTDLPTAHDIWQAPEVLNECAGCNACAKKCPTGAIDPNQFRLNAEKCLTFHNESSEDFPSWIDESWHHCLVGCMKCQKNCPANKDVRSWINRLAEFTHEESAMVLSGVKRSDMPKTLISKFGETGLLEDTALLARNLRYALQNQYDI